MSINAAHRKSVICSLLPERCDRLIDVGCGPITADYPYAAKAKHVTCVDPNIRILGSIPSNVRYLKANFTTVDLEENSYDVIIAADVFEHVPIEQEPLFVGRCISLLRPGGYIVVSVPHQGTFAYLDPYQLKPAIHRLLWRLGAYKHIYNGSCDIRKGHKHYTVGEMMNAFQTFKLIQVVYYGYFFDPLLTWAAALSGYSGRFPGYAWLEDACRREFGRDYAGRSFNVALKFHKSTGVA